MPDDRGTAAATALAYAPRDSLPARVPRHIGFIPDGNRRWALARGEPKSAGYAAGVAPGVALLRQCLQIGIEEVSIYGFTKENVHRPNEQVRAFQSACVSFAEQALALGVALCVIGDDGSRLFPAALRPYANVRTSGSMRVNLLANYGWVWDLQRGEKGGGIASALASRIDLVVRWGGRSRLSGFLPVQCAYADIRVVDTLWPDMQSDELLQALHWYASQDVTLGG